MSAHPILRQALVLFMLTWVAASSPAADTITAGPLLGLRDHRGMAAVRQGYPQTSLYRVYVKPGGVRKIGEHLETAVDEACREVWSAGLTPIVSFKLQPTEVVAGEWDDELKQLATWLLTKPAVWIVPWHEPEDDMPGAQFVGMFNRVYRVLKAANPALHIGYAAGSYNWKPGSSRTADPSAWVVAKADFYSCDVYSGPASTLTTILPEHSGFMRWHANIVHDGEYVITERGFKAAIAGEKLERARQIRREAEWLATSDMGKKCTAYLYWNDTGAENDPRLLLDAQGEAALAEVFSQLCPVKP